MPRLKRSEEWKTDHRKKVAEEIGVKDVRLWAVLNSKGNFSIKNATKLAKIMKSESQWAIWVKPDNMRAGAWSDYLESVKP